MTTVNWGATHVSSSDFYNFILSRSRKSRSMLSNMLTRGCDTLLVIGTV